MTKLNAETLYKKCDPDKFNFETTDEIDSSTTIIGQERLSSSLDFGIGMERDGFNIFALGPATTNKEEHLRKFFEDKSADRPTPPDICYVNNFEDTYKPSVLHLPNGRGTELEKEMNKLLNELVPILTSAFETEEYQNRRQALQEQFQDEQDQTFEDLQEKAREQGLALIRTPMGFSFVPLNDKGQMMDEEEIQNLSDKKREELQETTKELQEELQKIIQKMPSNQRKVRERMKKLDKEIATYAIKDLFNDVYEAFSDLEKVQNFLDNVEHDIVENVHTIMSNQGQQGGNQLAQLFGGGGGQSGSDNPVLDRYRVNVLVDHTETEGAPVIYEDNPNYKNLIGRIEYQSQMGGFTTNFNLIKPGAFHRANGGYLILDARQVLLEPFAWEGLKRVLKSGELKIETFGESYRAISTVSLEPDPIDLDVKVILLGERLLYYLLCEHDPEFNELFKVEADFEDEIERSDENDQRYAQLVAGLINKNKLRPFDKKAVARVIEQGSRMVSDNEKISTQTIDITDLLKESDYWAGESERNIVDVQDVEKAIEQQIYRSARIRDRIQESIKRETIFIDTEGTQIGQVNGLSVAQIGNLMFGQPSRITARVQLGSGEIINIEREVDLSGPIHSKGVLILKGFLGERYARERPLSLSASLVFEQSYSNIDGDSASCAELYALLSAIGDIPLKQSFSVTGSVNQHGRVQPIGGVNEKIEGFFDVCDNRGLTGKQGVLIPKSNEKNLMLRSDVREAVKEDKFHIYSVETIDQGMELLTDLQMGELRDDGTYPEGTINYIVTEKLNQFAQKRKAFAKSENGKE
ncbi:MAG TPA: ATP-binding protein [Balneolaceae bacterium]|nr:ATP-binding protein [Balneolaceae bacterium]